MSKFGFVILHYIALDLTIQCVDNIINRFSNRDIIITIIDNASPNNSGQDLKNRYQSNSQIEVILHNKNDGFARGNNIGFNYLKDHFNIDFMIVMNNDVIIEQNDFLEKIEELYDKHQFSVLGPDIYAPNLNNHQNPLEYQLNTIEGCNYWIKKYKQLLRKDNFNYYKLKILHYTVYFWTKPLLKLLFPKKFSQLTTKSTNISTEQMKSSSRYKQSEQEDVTLQGSCLIFSKSFIQKRKYAFYPKTFLYHEEHILHLQCRYEGLKTIYSPQISVLHYCSSTTNQLFSNREKYRLYWRENIKSIKEYIKLYKQYNINA